MTKHLLIQTICSNSLFSAIKFTLHLYAVTESTIPVQISIQSSCSYFPWDYSSPKKLLSTILSVIKMIESFPTIFEASSLRNTNHNETGCLIDLPADTLLIFFLLLLQLQFDASSFYLIYIYNPLDQGRVLDDFFTPNQPSIAHMTDPTTHTTEVPIMVLILRIPIMRCQVWPNIAGISYGLWPYHVLVSLHNAVTVPAGTYCTGVKYMMSRRQYIETSSYPLVHHQQRKH